MECFGNRVKRELLMVGELAEIVDSVDGVVVC